MVEPLSSPDDFTIQLAQWALDQLKNLDSLVMVYDRFAALLSQTPQPSDDNDLHARLGQIIFMKATRHSTDPPIDLCVRLCCLLSPDIIEHDKDSPDRIAYIHDHVFRCCKESLKPSGTIQTAGTGPKATLPTRNGENSAINNQEDTSLNHISLLVSKLYDTGLTSTANIHEYLQHLVASSVQIDARIEAICTLFEGHGTELSIEPWKGDRDSVFQWARTAVLQYPVTESTKNRLEAIVAKHHYNENQSTAQPLPRWQAIVKCQIETLLEMFMGQESDFSLISSQIIERVNTSKEEHSASTLKHVVELVVERAIDNEERSEVYAQLCRTISEHILPRVKDETIQGRDGQPINGGPLFRRYLLKMCQECFERAWCLEETDPTLNNSNASPSSSPETSNGINQRAMTARQGIGLTQFIAELFKLDMLVKVIMHDCIKKLLSNIAKPKEEGVESLCKLLTAIGKTLDDSPLDQMEMDTYFERMQTISNGIFIHPRIRNMLVDVIRLRRQWQATKPQPQTISSIRGQRGRGRGAQRGVHRGGFRRGGTHPDGWNALGGSNVHPHARGGGLSQFGPSSRFRGGNSNRGVVASRNPFSSWDDDLGLFSLSDDDDLPDIGGLQASFQIDDDGFVALPSNSHRARWGFRSGGPAAPKVEPARRKLDLLPRSNPIVADKREGRGPTAMSEEQARAKVREDVKEYLSGENVDEAIMALEAIPAYHRYLLVQRLVSAALDEDNKTVLLAEKLFAAAHQRGVISPKNFERGLLPTVKSAENLCIDVPKTYEWLARFIIAAGLNRSKAEELAGQIRVEGERRMPPKELLMRAYEKVASTTA